MTIVAIVFALGVVLLAVFDMRRFTAVRCIERSERLRLEFSDIRHRLVVHAGSGGMGEAEKPFLYFLYAGTTFMLRHGQHYQPISNMFCAALYTRQQSKSPPRLRREDVPESAEPLLRDYVRACDSMIQQFADPKLRLLAYLSGTSVRDLVRNAGRRRRAVLEEEQRIKEWREVGAGALALSSPSPAM
jgi:hypothetical protein